MLSYETTEARYFASSRMGEYKREASLSEQRFVWYHRSLNCTDWVRLDDVEATELEIELKEKQ